jgi:N-acetyl-gamma-glutamyl-phosphate reductase
VSVESRDTSRWHSLIAMPSAAIVGASGYAGQETLDRVLAHPELELLCLGSDSLAGEPGSALDLRLARVNGVLPRFVTNAEALASGADVVFLCLGHEEAAELAPPASGVVVDLSGGHRLADSAAYERWYGFSHPRADELGDWCYAIPELTPPTGRLISNPGCYATAALLALAPLGDLVDPESVAVDGKSGISGAGRALKASSHAGVVLDNVVPYKVGSHQHAAEMERALGYAVSFVPHVVPLRRGLVATCFVRPTQEGLRGRLEGTYAGAEAVTVLPPGAAPEIARVRGTDAAEIGVFEDGAGGRAVVICAIDNLGKGAAGQAVQNANLALGLPETAGLSLAGVLV